MPDPETGLDHGDRPHLTPGEVIAVVAGAGDTEAVSHLNSCAACRRRVGEWRSMCAVIAPVRVGRVTGNQAGCPSMEELASYAAGRIVDEPIGIHVAGCDRCAAILRDSLASPNEDDADGPVPLLLESSGRDWQRRMAGTFAAIHKPAIAHYWQYAAAAVFVLAAAIGWGLWSARRTSNPAVLLARAYTGARPFEYRLPDAGYGPVRQKRGEGSSFDRPESLDSAIAEIRRELAAHPEDPSVFALKGRAELLEQNYDAAIESLTRATSADNSDPATLGDLGVAYALRGEAEKRNIDCGQAMELLLRALRKRPSDQRIMFNLALIYERLSLVDEAIEIWRKFLQQNPVVGWQREAKSHLAAMERIKADKKEADEGLTKDPASFAARYGRAKAWDPEPYLDIFWTDWIPFADAHSVWRTAAEVLARRIAEAGDTSLADALAARAPSTAPAALEELAKAIGANQRGQSDVALSAARNAVVQLAESKQGAAAMRASLEFAYAEQRATLNLECEHVAASVAEQAERMSYVWLAAMAHLQDAACSEALGRPGQARALGERASAMLARAHFSQGSLLALGLVTEIDQLTGNQAPVWDRAPGGLRLYWTSGSSAYRAQQFQFVLKNAAALLGWNDSAIVFGRAAICSLGHVGNPGMEAINRVRLSTVLAESGDRDACERELSTAGRLVYQLSPGPARQHVNWVLALARANALLAQGRAREVLVETDRLEPIAATLRPADRANVFVMRGEALFAMRCWDAAAKAFEEGIELNQQRSASLRSPLERLAELETASHAYRALTQIQLLEDRDAAHALRTWLLYKGGRGFRNNSPVTVPEVTYAILPSGIAAWFSDQSGVRARMLVAPSLKIQAVAKRFLELCVSPSSDERDIKRLGQDLYGWLLLPELRRDGALRAVVRTDGWLSSIPFGALTDQQGKYLNQVLAIEEGTMFHHAGERSASRITRDTSALIVSAPTATAPGWARLPLLSGARAEAAEVNARFRNAELLQDSTVTIERLFTGISRARFVHFSGHGWSDGGNGALILPAGPGGEPRFVTSGELARQDWTHCSLAVLSACLTAIGESHEAVNNQSLVRAILSAGARRVIAARWNVDSEATRTLMGRFYGLLMGGETESEALSEAARGVASSGGWTHPYYWAGFQLFSAY